MATIPIEIVLQDAETPVEPTPTPTPESGEETNITVPDTGTISDVNNSGGIGSSASIILPAIIAVLAIGAIVAMLIHKHQKHQNDKLSKKEKLATVATSTIAILATTVLVGNLVIPATKAATNVEPGTAELDTVDKITITATREADSSTVTATAQNISYVTANLDFGYKVTASMAKGTATANFYLDGNTDSPYYIAPVTDGILTDNTWGYTLDEEAEEYLAIPLADAPATITKGNDNIIENKPVDIYYAIKADKSFPAGTYTGEIEYTLTDNNFPSTLTTMQGMTTEICESTYTPGKQVTDPVPTATLEDTRDHKTYTIAKLADGKCWMTQNLDLDLKDNVALTPADSDVSENWTPKNSTLTVDGTSVSGWSNSDTEPYSANPGNIYYYTSGNNESDKKYDLLEDCEREHPDGTCSHYHVGNYYNWSAAVASNNTEGMADQYYNAPSSICPKGWRLPKNRNSEGWAEGNEQDAMVSSYEGIVGELQIRDEGYQAYRSYLDGGFNTIRTNPLWLTRSGGIYYGSTGGTGSSGIYQSSTVARNYSIYQLNVGPDEIGFNNGNRRNGYSIRCLAE